MSMADILCPERNRSSSPPETPSRTPSSPPETPSPAGKKRRSRKAKARIIIQDGAYCKLLPVAKGNPVIEEISNFTLTIKRIFSVPDEMGGMVREMVIRGKNGSISKVTEVRSYDLASKSNFNKWLMSQGNFYFKGSQSDLDTLLDMLFSSPESKIIKRPGKVGWLPEDETWLFGNAAIRKGKRYTAGSDGVISVENDLYLPMSIVCSDPQKGASFLPLIDTNTSRERTREVQKQLSTLLKDNLGGYEAYLVLGFVAASAYSQEIFQLFRLPILFLSGPRQSGKNTLATVIMAHFGMGEDASQNAEDITPAALIRFLEYYSGLPLWCDEYRGSSPRCREKDSLLRSAYNRAGTGRGKLTFGVNSFIPSSLVLISGESLPSDSALMSRCVAFSLCEAKRNDEAFNEIRSLLPQLSSVFLRMLEEKTEDKVRDLLASIQRVTQYFTSMGFDARTSQHYAMLGESFCLFYNPDMNEAEIRSFYDWIIVQARIHEEGKRESTVLSEFFTAIESLRAKKLIDKTYVGFSAKSKLTADGVRPNRIYLYLRGIYDIWAEARRRVNQDIWGFDTIRTYLGQEPYFIEIKNAKISGISRRAAHLDTEKMSEDIVQMFCENFDWTE